LGSECPNFLTSLKTKKMQITEKKRTKNIIIRVSPTEVHNIKQVVRMEGGKNLSEYTRELILKRKPILEQQNN